jgi:exosome complex component RRP42
MMMPKIQRDRIIDYLKQGKRFDSRKPEEYRKIEVRTGVSNNAEGSASVKFGKTEVYAGVKLDVGEPYADSPNAGNLTVSAELSPIASPDFEMGPPSIKSIEMSRIIDRGLRESGFIEFEKLCIKDGEKVWNVYLDIYAVNDSGNMMDVAAMAALVALANAKVPHYDEKTGKIDKEKGLSKEGLPLNKEAMAFNMTLHKIGDKIVADPTKEEEEISDFRISIAVSSNKGKPRISSIQKGKEGAVSTEDMDKVLKLIESKFDEIYPEVEKKVWGK